MMEILLAKEYGFCGGVKRALRLLDQAIEQNPGQKIYSIGEIIHNTNVINAYRAKGVEIVRSIFDIGSGVGVVRAHGLPVSVIKEAEARGLKVIDASCPYVRLISTKIQEEIRGGASIYLVGEPGHPEVVAAANDFSDYVTVLDHAAFNAEKFCFPKGDVVLLSQTTMAEDTFLRIVGSFVSSCQKVTVYNTICESTRVRQASALEVAKEVDAMVIIGGKESSNTRRLYEICSAVTQAFCVENVEELDKAAFLGLKKIGITAGASTPDELISEACAVIKEW
jgi:4-hydroxy-3-methylbut-2-enyl diphosphate reductase